MRRFKSAFFSARIFGPGLMHFFWGLHSPPGWGMHLLQKMHKSRKMPVG